MKNLKSLTTFLSVILFLACFHVSAFGQDDKNRLATISASGSGVRWEITTQNAGLTITVSAPDGQVFRKEFRAGASPEFPLTDKQGNRLPDGEYNYEVRLTPVVSADTKKELAAARAKGGDDDAAAEREMRKRGRLPSQPLVQSGSFTILNGSVIVAGSVEPEAQRPSAQMEKRLRGLSQARPFVQTESFMRQEAAFIPARFADAGISPRAHAALPDQVIPDDLIVQGSLCVGFDCVNNESFGFDTIRLKENNTRIKFDDTSTSAGYPANDWQLTANDSASGGASKFSIEDITGSKVPFTVEAGSTTNSIYIDSTGRVGFRTSTPVLDIHANTSNTPGIRLEQNNSGGFSAQTWDMAGNEANFFIRDVTGGSLLSFRIRPGAPTSSIDISSDGDVGVGTASPLSKLHITGKVIGEGTGSGNNAFADFGKLNTVGSGEVGFQLGRSGVTTGVAVIQGAKEGVGANNLAIQPTGGNVGIGTTAPTDLLSVNGTASKPGGGSWSVFSDERLKTIKGQFNSGLKALMQLQPLRYEYRQNNALGLNLSGEHIGFGAQSLQKVIPEAVSKTGDGYLMVNNDPIIWTMLNAIKEQQKEIEQLKAQIRQLQPRASRSQRQRQRRR
ncbi:MAG TPA: tail fiber domain-containing protein [Pyrinomonadaceae bacterium]